MSSMGNNVKSTFKPEWQLGQLGTTLRRLEDADLNGVDALEAFFLDLDADQQYCARLLHEINKVRDTLIKHGLNREVAVATERLQENLVAKEIRDFLTDNYSDTGRWETLVAVESWANVTRFSMITMLVVAMIKIIGWIVGNGKALSGPGYADAGEYEKSVGDKITTFLENPDDERALLMVDKYQVKAVSEAVMEVAKNDLAAKEREALVFAASFIDKAIAVSPKGPAYMSELAAHMGRNPLQQLLDDLKGEGKMSPSSITETLVNYLARLKVVNGVYNRDASKRAWKMLPRQLQEAGFQIPNQHVFESVGSSISMLQTVFEQLEMAFARFNKGDLKAALGEDNPNAERDVKNWETGAMHFGQGMTSFITEIGHQINVVNSGKEFEDDNSPMIASKESVDSFIGMREAGFIGDYKVYAMTKATFLGEAGLAALRDNSMMKTADYQGVLNAMFELGPKELAKPNNVSGLAAAADLQRYLERFRKVADEWSKRVRGQSPGLYDYFNTEIIKAAKNTDKRFDHLLVQQYHMEFFPTEDHDFIEGMRRAFTMAKNFCLLATELQTMVNNSDQNPFTKNKK